MAMRILISMLFSLLCCSAQPSVIKIGYTELRLGMAKSDVLTKLAGEFELSGGGEGDVWFIRNRDHSSSDWSIGTVTFFGERLTMISKNLGDMDGQSSARALGNLFYALQSSQKPNTNNWIVMSATTQEINKTFEQDGGKEAASGTSN